MLEQLVNKNTNIIKKLTALTSKFEPLSIEQDGSNYNGTPMLNGKKMRFIKYNTNGHCHAQGYQCLVSHSSRTCSRPSPNHKKDATRENTMGFSTKNKEWICSHYEEMGCWVSQEPRR